MIRGNSNNNFNFRHEYTEVKKERINLLVILASVISSLGGILFGYDIGIISAAILQIRTEFGLSTLMQEVVTSSVLFGAFLSSLVAGSIVDYFGRRASIFFTSILFLAGSAVLVFAVDLPMVLVGRIVIGFGVALSTAAECTYISEISPPRWRGLLVSLNEFGITIGFLLAYVCGFLFVSFTSGWRFMFGMAAIPAVVQLIGVAFLPPSPHFLVLKGKDELAAKTIVRLFGDIDPQVVVDEIKTSLKNSKSSKLRDIFSSLDSMRYRMMIGILLVLLQQFTGNSNILYYAPLIFQKFGYCTDRDSTLVSVSLGAIKVVTAAIALALVDRFGRRVFLCCGATVMGISILILGVVTIYTNPSKVPTESTLVAIGSDIVVGNPPYIEFNSSYWNESDHSLAIHAYKVDNNFTVGNFSISSCQSSSESLLVKILSVVALMAYICGYQFSFGIGTWLVLSEIFPTAVRGRSVSIATSLYWASNLLLTVSFFTVIECIGLSVLFIIYACVCFLAVIFVFAFVPETKQKTLEEISLELNTGPRISLCRKDSEEINSKRKSRDDESQIRYRSYQNDSQELETYTAQPSAT